MQQWLIFSSMWCYATSNIISCPLLLVLTARPRQVYNEVDYTIQRLSTIKKDLSIDKSEQLQEAMSLMDRMQGCIAFAFLTMLECCMHKLFSCLIMQGLLLSMFRTCHSWVHHMSDASLHCLHILGQIVSLMHLDVTWSFVLLSLQSHFSLANLSECLRLVCRCCLTFSAHNPVVSLLACRVVLVLMCRALSLLTSNFPGISLCRTPTSLTSSGRTRPSCWTGGFLFALP